jgi:pyruvate/2-oxoglutarate dehydrogenase complex dihydrolipoamide dehydrogenase (E3) component
MDEFDVVVIGTGSAGKPLAGELARAGRSVLAIEQALVGGECAYLACIPSKALLLAARRQRDQPGQDHQHSQPDQHSQQLSEPGPRSGPDRAAFAAAVAARDRSTGHRDDSHALTALEKDGVTVLRGSATIGPGFVTIDSTAGIRTARWRQALVLATGAEAVLPPIEGLAEAATWTSPDALSSDELPNRLTILGGGAIGCELAQVYASFGTQVTLIEAADTLLPREPGWVGEALAEVLRNDGVDVRTGTSVSSVEPGSSQPEARAARVHTDDGAQMEADRILVAVGKRPRTSGYGLESLGIEAREADGALAVDGRLRVITEAGALDDVFAIGDVTGIAPYTHTANYHARLVVAQLLGHGRDADHTGIPRVVYTDPPVLCTGETEQTARGQGIETVSSSYDVTKTSRSALERIADPDDHRPARLELIADAHSGVLLGAAAIGPEADSWAAELALAVRIGMTVHTLAQHLHAFPSWTEAIHIPARALAEQIPEPES